MAETKRCQVCGNEEDAPVTGDVLLVDAGITTYGKVVDGECEPCRNGREAIEAMEQQHPAKLDAPPADLVGLRAIIGTLDDGSDMEYNPDDAGAIQRDNLRRAGNAGRAVLAYADRVYYGGGNEDWDTVFGDLLGDLMHLCDALGVDFDAKIERGRFHYEPELAGQL